MANNERPRKKDSARLVWDSKPRRAPNPRDIEFRTAEVLSYAKLDRKHKLKVTYRDETGILRNYEIDFVVKTTERMYLVETKADRDSDSPNVAVKARAAVVWCNQASTVAPPQDCQQPQEWEYVLLSESLFKSNLGLGFDAFAPLCRGLRDRVIAQGEQMLFV